MSIYEPLAEWSRWAWPLLANHLWQATLFSLFVLIVSLPLKRAPARVRYSLWLIALTKFILPATAVASVLSRAGIDFNHLLTSNGGGTVNGLGLSPILSPVSSPPASLSVIELAPSGSGSASIPHIIPAQFHSYGYDALTLIWIAGCLLLFGSWLKRRRVLSATIRSGKIVTGGRELEIFERVRSWLDLRRKITLITSPTIAEPGVWRIFRPVVVLPEGISSRLTDSELEAVLMHELVHVEQWDNLVGVLQRAICCLLWFHPLVWLLDRWLLAEREQSCDDTVIKLSGESKVYASSITKVCRHSMGWAQPGLSSATGSNLKKRIKRIMAVDVNRNLSILHWALLCSVAAVLFVLSAAAGGIDGREAPLLSSGSNVTDTRFVGTPSEDFQGNAVETVKERASKPTALQQSRDTSQQTIQGPIASVQVTGGAERIAADVGIFAEPGQPLTENPPIRRITPVPSADISAAIIPVAATAQVNLAEFVGRYEVDPARAENFVLDITLERGELWLKPSHAPKRKLLLKAEMRLSDLHSDFRFTGIQDKGGRVIGLRLDSWSSDVIARKLMLPQPSLNGNTTFKLSGYPNARIVAVAGSFNNWNQSQFLFARVDGEWICKINLPPGKYEYKLIVDGNWLVDPRNSETTHDDRGNENSVLVTD